MTTDPACPARKYADGKTRQLFDGPLDCGVRQYHGQRMLEASVAEIAYERPNKMINIKSRLIDSLNATAIVPQIKLITIAVGIVNIGCMSHRRSLLLIRFRRTLDHVAIQAAPIETAMYSAN